MKLAIILILSIALRAQTPAGGCGEESGKAAAPPAKAFSDAAGISSDAAAGISSDAAGISRADAAKPASRSTVIPVLAQIRRSNGQRTISCWCGSVGAAALIAANKTQQVTILPGLTGGFRFDHILVQESTRFQDGPATLSVSAGRPEAAAELVPPFDLKSEAAPQNFWFDRPAPPTLIGTYALVLQFSAPSALGTGSASHFTSGAVNWEVCGYTVQ
jgi:hypothetical protein